MINNLTRSFSNRLVISLAWMIVTIGCLFLYRGSPVHFLFFSAAFWLLAIDALRRPGTFAYSFLVLFIVLGFWAKCALHLYLGYDYLEPVGAFDDSASSWDQVLLVSAIGSLAVLVARKLFDLIFKAEKHSFVASNASFVPGWYAGVRRWLWAAALLAGTALAIANMVLGIAQVGLAPTLNLPWPLNGLIAWMLGFGLSAFLLTLFFWDQLLGKSWRAGWAGVLLEATLSNVAVMSRATYIFHSMPALLVLLKQRIPLEKKPFRTGSKLIAVWLALLLLCLVMVMNARYEARAPETGISWVQKTMQRISRLVVDRWIGMEGVMAVVSHPDKDMALLKRGLSERRVPGQFDLYTSEIALVPTNEIDASTTRYATLPGVIAFFFYAGSWFWMIAGVMALTLIMLGLEQIVMRLCRNPYLSATWGMATAQGVASFGIGNLQFLTYWTICFVFVLMIYSAQRFSR